MSHRPLGNEQTNYRSTDLYLPGEPSNLSLHPVPLLIQSLVGKPQKSFSRGSRFDATTADIRLQSVTETYNAISRDGISLTASINIRYRLKREAVPQLHQSIGPNYVQALIGPEIGNRMREVIAEYTAEDVYSTKREEIQTKIRERAETKLGEKMMVGAQRAEIARTWTTLLTRIPAVRHDQSDQHAHPRH